VIGSIHRLDRTHEPELFKAVIGGYGLFGVILEAELDLVPAQWYDFEQQVVDTAAFAGHFEHDLAPDADVAMMYAHLSTAPDRLLQQAIVYTYRHTNPGLAPDTDSGGHPPLRAEQDSRIGRLVLNLARTGDLGSDVKWAAQEHLLPHLRRCVRARNDALTDGEACLVTRNQALYNDLGLLDNRLEEYTDILQEYFLPPERLAGFLTDAAGVLRGHDAVLLSASIRSVNAEDISGAVDVDTSNGSISVSLAVDQAGPIKLESSNGSLHAEVGPAFAGTMKMDTSNGSVKVVDLTGRAKSCELRNSSGTVRFTDSGVESKLDTSNGRIELVISG